MTRPRLLDLFCGAGGAAMGYHRAGFEVVGVDIKPQPQYPFEFHQADALHFLSQYAPGGSVGPDQPAPFGKAQFHAIHASPPCQAYSPLRAVHGREYPDMLAVVRAHLIAVGLPWVIENVPGAPLTHGVYLCGTMFGLRVYRHRWFESSLFMWQPDHPAHTVKAGGHKAQRQRKAAYLAGGFVTVTGNVGSYAGPAMGIDWMTGEALSQAIPPAYTEWIGRQLMVHLERAA